jgi:hypothetical protein
MGTFCCGASPLSLYDTPLLVANQGMDVEMKYFRGRPTIIRLLFPIFVSNQSHDAGDLAR